MLCLCTIVLWANPGFTENNGKIRILLIGDSTTEGGKPVFENTIAQLLNAYPSMPLTDVINVGKGGETAFKLLDSGRYDKYVQDVDSVDYIFIRYGINDWFQRQPLADNFPNDMHRVIERLRLDHPKAQIIVMTVIPFLNKKQSAIVNKLNAKIAAAEKLELFDIYPAYLKGLKEYGNNSMNIRFFPLSEIPEKFHAAIKPYTSYSNWKKTDYVSVKSTELDPLLGHLPGWYANRHPNPMGYNLIAREIVNYLKTKINNESKN